ncbi:photosynthetic complex putative assembly protein PuhB [Polynucleobacter antarcticus]|uniref:Phosphopantetheine adenylyltransferase n=1 Tax=Polynucleobacter antarcticus TaxID=1743162 RepID=A0A6M9PP61_9BURK|nr:photosynthetic complex putative assembly protein PuhB [Polynucleobacter antarcticus]QKM62191.1 phosphopantetheine adenylyltransferase [Polynucleobacter antarcticus]
MSLNIHSAPEHELEPEYGLPEKLPEGEQIVWQGSPDLKVLLLQVFRFKALLLYFGLLLGYQVFTGFSDGESATAVFFSGVRVAAFSGLGLGLIALLGYLIASTTVYTITNKRVVMRIGIVLNMTFNFPLKMIESADCGVEKKGFGDIYLKLNQDTKIAIFHLWPHARPGQWAAPQPALRCIRDCAAVSQLLVQAWAQENNTSAKVVQTPDSSVATHHLRYSEIEAA